MHRVKLSGSMKSVAKISSGTVIGQAISIVTLPIITRIYGAGIMGIWATILSIATFIQSFSDMGLSNSIMIEKDEENLEKIYSVVSTLSFFISLFSSIFMLLYFVIIKHNNFIDGCFYSLFVLLYSVTIKQVNTCYVWLNRYKKYNVLMKNPIINYSTVAIFSITFGVLGLKKYGYFIGVILGQFVTLINMRHYLPKKRMISKFIDIKLICKQYSNFVKYQTPNSVLFQFRQQLPVLLIGTLFGDTLLGYYSVSMKILNMPVTYLGQALGKVFYQTISEMRRKGQEIGNYVMRNLKRAVLVATIPVMLLFAFGDIIAVLFFGSDYIIAGGILRIVVFRTFFTFVSAATQGVEIVIEKQKLAMYITFTQSIMGSLSVIAGYYLFGSIYITVALIVISFIILELVYFNKLITSMECETSKYFKLLTLAFLFIIMMGYIFRLLGYSAINNFNLKSLSWFRALP